MNCYVFSEDLKNKMKCLQNICFVLFLITVSDIYADTCTDEGANLSRCLIKAQEGGVEAQYHLGWIYRQGKVVSQDYNKAVKWYTKAAVQGHALAQTWLGVMYNLGFGVNRDYKAAAKWYREAADQGNPLGQLRLAAFYSQGDGVAKNLKEAEKWYLRSASHDGDYTYAKKMIKEMYDDNKDDLSPILHSIK
jgi:TPR repeat protein